MLTIKLGGYTPSEIILLHSLIQNASDEIRKTLCNETDCSKCDFRHLCCDFALAEKFTQKQSTEVLRKMLEVKK